MIKRRGGSNEATKGPSVWQDKRRKKRQNLWGSTEADRSLDRRPDSAHFLKCMRPRCTTTGPNAFPIKMQTRSNRNNAHQPGAVKRSYGWLLKTGKQNLY
ncbi:conserved hypothetical protein [Trichinella spiralis]|uniref:Uncharacterized protein n=1 Tax=Trichinella spiralis TaxID=6334 RepID=E5SPF5_TRISP|nr:conserved hypothetical protein [Trichinella spiralis]KRY41396.1 hypothetical protein T01_16314 [Trichinella spiralis]